MLVRGFEDLVSCSICYALVIKGNARLHRLWHEEKI